jgi:hypothetical protein
MGARLGCPLGAATDAFSANIEQCPLRRLHKQSVSINKIACQRGIGASVVQRIVSNDSLTNAHHNALGSGETHGAATRRVPEKQRNVNASQLSIEKFIRNGPKQRSILPLTRGVLSCADAPPRN